MQRCGTVLLDGARHKEMLRVSMPAYRSTLEHCCTGCSRQARCERYNHVRRCTRGCPVPQEHRREAAEAASGLVSAGPSAAAGEEAAPIVFLHGVGLGMVLPRCSHPVGVRPLLCFR